MSGKYCSNFVTKTTTYFPLFPSMPEKDDEISLVIEVQTPTATVRFHWFISAFRATNTTDGQT
jgi:hypothetical protein